MADKIKHIDAAKQREFLAGMNRYEGEILRAAAELAPLNVAWLLGRMVKSEHAARGVDIPGLIRNCPDGVNPFAAPAFFLMLFNLWMDLRRDQFGTARNRRAVVRRQFDEIIAAIQETVPRVGKGKAPVGLFERDQRRRVAAEAQKLEAVLADLLLRLGRLVDYSSERALFMQVRRVDPSLQHSKEIAHALWLNRRRRGPTPLKKVARLLAAESAQTLDLSALVEEEPKRARPRKNSRR